MYIHRVAFIQELQEHPVKPLTSDCKLKVRSTYSQHHATNYSDFTLFRPILTVSILDLRSVGILRSRGRMIVITRSALKLAKQRRTEEMKVRFMSHLSPLCIC